MTRLTPTLPPLLYPRTVTTFTKTLMFMAFAGKMFKIDWIEFTSQMSWQSFNLIILLLGWWQSSEITIVEVMTEFGKYHNSFVFSGLIASAQAFSEVVFRL